MGLSFNTSPTVIEGVAIAHLPQRINLSSALLSPKSLNYSDIVAFIIGAVSGTAAPVISLSYSIRQLLSGLIYSVIYNLYLSPIATVPGPLTAKLSPVSNLIHMYRKGMLLDDADTCCRCIAMVDARCAFPAP